MISSIQCCIGDAPLEFRTRTLIQCNELLYIVKEKQAPG